MAHYTVSKRENKKGNTYLARVREKSKGIVVFSKSKSFHTKSAALKWAKQTLHKVEHNTELASFDLVDCTLTELIQSYIEKKQASDKPLCRTALYSYKQISSCKLGKLTVSRITSRDIVDFAIERRSQPSNPSGATIAVDISSLRKVLKIARSLFNINVTEEAVVLAYPALHDLKLLSRSQKRS